MPVTRFESQVVASTVGTADIDKLTAALVKQAEAVEGLGKKANSSNFNAFAESVRNGIENPLQAIGAAAERALKAIGPVGVGVAAAAATIVTLGKVGFDAARELGALGDRLGDIAIRTGLTVREVGEFSFAMKRAGGDISGVEAMMRKLSQGLADGSEEGKKSAEGMRDLGIATRTFSGDAVPMSQIILQLSEKLGAMTDTAQRNSLAIKIMGRSALEALPDMLELAQGVKRARDIGIAPTEEDVKRWDGYLKQVAEADALWDRLKRNVKEPLVGVISVVLKWGTASSNVPGGNPNAPLADGADIIGGIPQSVLLGAASRVAGIQGSGMSEMERQIALSVGAGSATVGSSRRAYGNTLAGAQYQAEQAKQKSDRLREQYFALEGSAGSAAVNAKRQEWSDAESAATRLTEKVKLLAKEEANRIQILEKIHELIMQGLTAYVIGTGQNTTIVTGDKIADANAPQRRTPSLFGRGRSPFADAQYANDLLSAPDYAQGLQVVNGQVTFVSPSSTRTDQAGAGAFGAYSAGSLEEAQRNQQSRIFGINAGAGYLSRLGELRAGPGGEAQAAQQTAALRESALRMEYQITGDIAKYRESSLQNELDLSLRIAEVEEQRKRSFENAATGLFQAAVAGNVPGFLRSQANGIADKVVGNAAGLAYDRVKDLIPHASGTLGKLLEGTPFGPDPVKASLDANTAATIANTAALASGGGSASGRGAGSPVSSLLRKFGILDNYGAPAGAGGGSAVDPFGSGEGDGAETYGMPKGSSGDSGGEYSGGLSGGARGLGIASAAALGAFGIYSGIRSGGVRGGLTAGGSALAAAGAILPLISKSLAVAGPIGMAAGMALGLVTTVLGDPKQRRQEQIARDLETSQYRAPVSINASMTTFGGYADYDRFGGVRGSGFSPFPSGVDQPYYDSRRNISVPGRTDSFYGAPIAINVYAMDTKNIVDRSDDIAHALNHAIQTGRAPGLQETLRAL